MKLPGFLARFLDVEHRAGYTNAAVDALLASAGGNSPANVGATAALEQAVRTISLPFATADISGPVRAAEGLDGPFLVDLVRRLMLTGNSVYAIDLDPAGQIALLPASSFRVGGTAQRWNYELETPTPSGQHVTRRIPADGVVHCRVNQTMEEPWHGIPPWQSAGLTASTLAFIERSLRWDSEMPTGGLMPMPDGVNQAQANNLANALRNGKGGLTPVETTASGFGQGQLAAPRADYDQKRFGPNIPQANLLVRDSTANQLLHAYGVSESLLVSDGNAIIQARRSFYLDTVEPLARIIEREIAEKLDEPIRLDFTFANYRDHQRNSRALQSYITAGLTLAQAAAIIGIDLTVGAGAGGFRSDNPGQQDGQDEGWYCTINDERMTLAEALKRYPKLFDAARDDAGIFSASR